MTGALDALARWRATDARTADPWHALWAMMVGFFMILVDATIVAVANPSIMDALGADYDAVIWVTSAYLLAYAVPLLLAGRLGDRYGPKTLYLAGLAIFTAASLWCGLAGSIEMLIAARVVQGVGAALLTPQTLSAITRLFPAQRRGVALSIWGATAGVATLVGPLAGGVLVGALGWQWIFIVNVPVGVLGLLLAWWLVPALPTEVRGFDVLGVLLSGLGMFLIVFGLQEGQSHDWAVWIWGLIVLGLGFMAAFVYWQSVHPGEPLIPLRIFRDRDFSVSTLGISVIGFAVTAMILPVMFYAQAVCGLSPTRAALLTAPMAIASGGLAPVVGKLVDRYPPTPIVGFGFSALAIALTWLSVEMTATTPIWRLVLPLTLMGIGMAFIWSPLAATATQHLPGDLAGAGSGVYNATRQVGGVLGSAGMAAFMTSRLSAEMPGAGERPAGGEGSVTHLPGFLHPPFAAALSQSLLLPAFVALLGVVAAVFLRGSATPARRAAAPARRVEEPDWFHDDDEYLEYEVDHGAHDHGTGGAGRRAATVVAEPAADDGVTEPLHAHVEHPLPAPADEWHGGPVDSWEHLAVEDRRDAEVADRHDGHGPAAVPPPGAAEVTDVHPRVDEQPAAAPAWRSILDDLLAADDVPSVPAREPNPAAIGHAHNGFHVNGFQSDGSRIDGSRSDGSRSDGFRSDGSRVSGGEHLVVPPPARRGRHSRDETARDDGDAGTYGKHSMPFRDA